MEPTVALPAGIAHTFRLKLIWNDVKRGSNTYGTIFSVNTDGSLFTKLWDFDGTNSGSYPQDRFCCRFEPDGMTSSGGSNNYGTLFTIGTDGTGFSKYPDFDGAHGSNPYGSLVLSGTTPVWNDE